MAEELRSWIDGGEDLRLDKWYSEYGEYFIRDLITNKSEVDYAKLGRKIAFERQRKQYNDGDMDFYIDMNKRELKRVKRISEFEGVDKKKCERIKRDIERAIEKFEDYEKHIFEIPSEPRYRTVKYEGFGGIVKDKVYFYEPIIYEEKLDGMYFVNFKSRASKEEKEEILRHIDKIIMKNKRAAGVKIKIDNTEIKRRRACYYTPLEDKVVIGTMDALNRGWRGGKVIGHELGHRPHSMTDTSYEHLAISKEDKKEWEGLTEKYYQKYRIQKEPMKWRRFDYPINAEDYYGDRNKEHFYSEMWAEVTSVVTSPDDKWHDREEETKRLKEYFPDLKEFMEKIYGL
ncbi:MAG TPA: hypothetical protein GXX70_06520 [Tepidimicrobium sp.]|nr:hypothetical protein [Tepidimicrobium sp.]